MKIKYSVDFKRIMTMAVTRNGKIETMRVGEVELFQTNIDGTLDFVVKIWPQTPASLIKQIEANPGIMGMTAETLPAKGFVILPDTAKFEAIDDPEAETMEKLRATINELEVRLNTLEGKDVS